MKLGRRGACLHLYGLMMEERRCFAEVGLNLITDYFLKKVSLGYKN